MEYSRIITRLFPLKGELTKEIIENADITDSTSCKGALTLKQALADNVDICDSILWAFSDGVITVDNERIRVTTSEKINFVTTTEPKTVIFTLTHLL